MTLAAPVLVEALGWAATATFVASYLCARAGMLVRVQMVGGVMWIVYGALVGAPPVVAANTLVVLAAAWKAWRPRPALDSTFSEPGAARTPRPEDP